MRNPKPVPSPKPAREPGRDPNQAHLLIKGRKKADVTVPIKRGKDLILGRDPAADIILDSPGISRKHVKLSYDGEGYYLTDLGSRNGTFLDKVRLFPGVAEEWDPEKTARLGEVYTLRLVKAGQLVPEEPAPVRPSSKPPGTDYQVGEQIQMQLKETHVAVAPGSKVVMPVVLYNQGTLVAHFQVAVEGVPPGWYTVHPKEVYTMPGQEQTIQITFHPPAVSASRAADYSLTLRATSRENPNDKVEKYPALTVLPFTKFESELSQHSIRAGRTARLHIQNQSNKPERFVVKFKDKAGDLEFKPAQVELEIPEGEEGLVEFRPKMRGFPRLFGTEKSHPFTTSVSLPALPDEKPVNHPANVSSKGLLPPWLLPSAAAGLALLLLFGPKLIKQISIAAQPNITATITAPSASSTVNGDNGTSTPAATIESVAPTTQEELCGSKSPPSYDYNQGDKARVTFAKGEPLQVLEEPKLPAQNIIGELEEGVEFEIMKGDPVCYYTNKEPGKEAGVIFWQIQVDESMGQFANGTNQGWVVEGDKTIDYIEPVK